MNIGFVIASQILRKPHGRENVTPTFNKRGLQIKKSFEKFLKQADNK